MEKILSQGHNSYIPAIPVLDVPDHEKLVSQTEKLSKFMVLGVVASSSKNEWVSADAYIKTCTTMNKKNLMMQIMCGNKMQHFVMWRKNMGTNSMRRCQTSEARICGLPSRLIKIFWNLAMGVDLGGMGGYNKLND